MSIKTLNAQLEQLLEDEPSLNTEYSISDAEKAELWDMVKDFDEYATKYELIQEDINEALKIECGIELDINSVKNIKTPNLTKYKDSFDLSDQLKWLIEYLNKENRNNIFGFKVSNVGTIDYHFNNIHYTKDFCIPIGKCYKNSAKLVKNAKDAFGIFHMKYGKNRHWNLSCNAILNIPLEFNKPVWVSPSRNNKKYNYVFYSKNGFKYAFGIPINDNHETILISCY